MERRLTFDVTELQYLANLCHDCGSCLPACQYAPPHEFAVDVPQTLKRIRADSYGDFAWPPAASPAFAQSGRLATNACAIAIALFAAATFAFGPISKPAMIAVFGLAGLGVAGLLGASVARCWRAIGGPALSLGDVPAMLSALGDAMRLRNLDGGGEGCPRRTYHHLAFYGFALCFAATVVAAFYDNFLGWPPPYPLLSAPVVLGTVGGVTLLAGAAGLLKMANDLSFIVMLILVAFTGLLLLALRATPVMGPLLAIHLGIVLGLFVTMPYGKFVHGFYRFAALLRDAIEKRRTAT
jgi:citrate/tricarballylate utilization protein